MKPMQRFLITLVSMLFSGAVLSASASPANAAREAATKSLEAFNVPGLAVVIVHNGEVVLAEGFGVRDIGSKAPVTADTLFGIASNTKAFTTAALAKLVAINKLSWDDPVVRYIPEFRLSDPQRSAELTIRDLVSHRSGLGLGAGDLMIWPNTDKTTSDIIASLAHVPLKDGLREKFNYNNLMFVVAGEVIARVSGMPYSNYIEKQFLQPLGMTNTYVGYSSIPVENTNRAVGTIEYQGELKRFGLDYIEDFRAAGAMAANVNDLGKWLIANLESPPEQNWNLTTPLRDGMGYGLGWFVKQQHGVKHVYHSGGILGMLSLTTLIPEKNFGMVVLSNQQAFGALTAVTQEALEQVLDVPDRDWVADEQKKYQASMREKLLFSIEQPDNIRPSLPLRAYVGTYRDPWYGDVTVRARDGKLLIDFAHTELLTGELEHYNGDTFVIRWAEPLLEADAFIDFSADRDNRVNSATIEAAAPFTDFSFDFHNLKLVKQD
ncbi:serine hydrolase [Pseudidiomarina woesei]|uniref:CubicO group peptidase, beta-lactamase class C family n=1 Tax=Pseudidiomarina woesei TaxID=1381080 RepID=A0A0K6H8G3_9GAMM|nr:CubicO group peptidase, beta-lactamase class C family [Pseudidiomarina woesei]